MITKIFCVGFLVAMELIIVCLIIKISKLEAINKLLSEENHKIFEALDRNRDAFSEAVQIITQVVEQKSKGENNENR